MESRKLKIALKTISSILLTLVVLLTFLLVGIRLFGIKVLTVLSPSMEPNYPTGSLIYLVDVDPSTLQVEDVITYKLTGGTTATHRIKEIVPDENDPTVVRFRTKGDNNDTYDGSLVDFAQVEGKVVFCIPLLGYVAQKIQHPPGNYIVLGIGLATLFFVMTVDAITDEKNESKRKTKIT